MTGASLSVLAAWACAGDVNTIEVGEQTSISDKAVVHAAKIKHDLPTKIGSRVVIGQCPQPPPLRISVGHGMAGRGGRG